MNCSVTLTAEEFKNIHNALWELDCVSRDLEDTLHPNLFAKLNKARVTIRENLENAYVQESQDFDGKLNHYTEVRKSHGFITEWSMFDVEDLTEQHPWPDARQLIYKANGETKPHTEMIPGGNWVGLWHAADRAIRESGDLHHIFIEGFVPVKGDERVLELHTGS